MKFSLVILALFDVIQSNKFYRSDPDQFYYHFLTWTYRKKVSNIGHKPKLLNDHSTLFDSMTQNNHYNFSFYIISQQSYQNKYDEHISSVQG